MLYSHMKKELLDMFYADRSVMESQVDKMNERMKAILRTTRMGSRALQPGEDPPLMRRTGRGVLGKGLFANKDYTKGEYITSFPLDCTLYRDEDDGGRTKVCYAACVDVEAVEAGAGDAVAKNRKFAHLVTDQGMPLSMAMPLSLVPDANDDCLYHWGHWADDAAALPVRATNAKLAAREYSEASFAKANATHIMVANGIFVWTVATREIAKGEEIFVAHGVNWWKSWNLMQAAAAAASDHDHKTHAPSSSPGDNDDDDDQDDAE